MTTHAGGNASAPIVQGLWIGERLTAMQQCSIQSFLDAGHPYHLYTYGPIEGVPRGATVLDAGALISSDRIWRYRDFDSPAGFSNQFRYRLLEQRGGTWADLDVICVRPLPKSDYLLPAQAYADAPAANCLLRAPPGSELLVRARIAADAVDPLTAAWGDTGPGLMSKLIGQLGLELLPVEAVCPIGYHEWHLLISDDPIEQGEVRQRTASSFAIHLWHEMWRRAGLDGTEPVPRNSLYGQLLERFRPVLD